MSQCEERAVFTDGSPVPETCTCGSYTRRSIGQVGSVTYQGVRHNLGSPCEQVDPPWFSPVGLARREQRWNEDARRLVKALDEYEECHPKGAICLMHALTAAKEAMDVSPHA